MHRKIGIVAAFFGFTGVLLGAFGAHGLKDLVDVSSVMSFETGVRYQLLHALFLLFLSMGSQFDVRTVNRIFWLVALGVFLFSGSIYLLATNALTGFDFTKIALLTPLGGTLLIVAWVLLLSAFIRMKK